MFDNSLKIYKNAKVDIDYHMEGSDDLRLKLIFENERPHIFDKNAFENNLIIEADKKTIREKFNGGTYIFYQGELLQYKDSFYNGYVRSEDEIKLLSDLIGIKTTTASERQQVGSRGLFNNFRQNTIQKHVFLGGEGHEFDLSIKELGAGGEFKNKLIHKWSPFDDKIQISLETERLICENGMVGMSPFVTKEVPIVNRHLEHLNLINVQLQPEINSLLKERFTNMQRTNASLHSMMSAHNILTDRVKSNKSGNQISNGNSSLIKLKHLVDVKNSLGNVYEKEVFSNKEQSKSLKGNLTQFDLFNVLTEASSHSEGSSDNTIKLQKDINRLVFDELNDKKSVQGKAHQLSSDSDHSRIFFGGDK